MKTAFIPLTLGATLALASPIDILAKRTTCTVIFTGINSEGGGGPGQSPINNFDFDVGGTGLKGWAHSFSQNVGGGYSYTAPTSQWGGQNPLVVSGSYNYGGISWSDCHLTKAGQTYSGAVTNHINPDIVTVTTSKCTITFPCIAG